MLNFHPYLRLMRFDKPIGIILLWIPTAWALWMAYQGTPPLGILMYFFVGTIVLRAAGCVINDIADRHIDKEVMRTRDRPLATGEVTRHAALLLLSLLLAVALLIVLQLPRLCFYESFLALLVTFIYPFCKRWLSAPQLVSDGLRGCGCGVDDVRTYVMVIKYRVGSLLRYHVCHG